MLEAATVVAALANRRCGRCHDTGPEVNPASPVLSGTVDAEAAWLLQVTDAFTRSPVVAHLRDRLAAALPAPDPQPHPRSPPPPPASGNHQEPPGFASGRTVRLSVRFCVRHFGPAGARAA